MTIAAEIILISTAFQSNGILSYTLNIFKTKLFLKKYATFQTSSVKLHQQPETALLTRRAK